MMNPLRGTVSYVYTVCIKKHDIIKQSVYMIKYNLI